MNLHTCTDQFLSKTALITAPSLVLRKVISLRLIKVTNTVTAKGFRLVPLDRSLSQSCVIVARKEIIMANIVFTFKITCAFWAEF